ncbi:MAG TPA: hypothetical protein VHT51_13175 [Micropepsaceae bacterium]|nr:hypothetical protein [Micropepsaceae bacterium]
MSLNSPKMIGLAAAIGLLSVGSFPAAAAEKVPTGSSLPTNVGASTTTQSAADLSPADADRTNVQPSQSCGSTALTAERFADLFYTIASHGNLLDVDFIEQTLQVHFKANTVTEGGIPNPHRKYYVADSIFGAPIALSLDVIDDPAQQQARHSIGILRFDFGRFSDCMKASLSALSRPFKGPFVPTVFPGVSYEAGSGVNLPGYNGSIIHAGFSYRTADQLVLRAAIQHAP